ncbi:MAG: divalent cation tolerance protein CutA [Gammaproteobacteria bacterium]
MASFSLSQTAATAAFCNAPKTAARETARQLADGKIAACVNILPAYRPVYYRRGEVCEEKESPAVKTAAPPKAVRRPHFCAPPEFFTRRNPASGKSGIHFDTFGNRAETKRRGKGV